MKKWICLLSAILLAFCGCSQKAAFTVLKNGNVAGEDGTEYAFVANEGFLYYLGETEHVGYVKGEAKTMEHMGGENPTGMYRIQGGETDNVLIRCLPESEWFSIYRKASLEPFDFSVDNCVRLEFSSGIMPLWQDAVHVECGKGIEDPREIAAFLTDVRSQKSPRDAGLYDLVKKEDGSWENCSTFAVVYGFFEEEPNLVIQMQVTSYNDLAYSIKIEGEEYVLPNHWLLELQTECCGQTTAG